MSRLLILAIPLLCLALLMQGALPIDEVMSGAWARLLGENVGWNPLLDERLPRLIVILCTGASLAVSGAVMQGLFHNPLASPSVLGISLGGSLAVLLLFIMGWQLTYPFAVAIFAFVGAVVTLCTVYLLSRHSAGTHSLVLTGLALGTFLLAVEGALLYMFRDRYSLIQLWMEWSAGSFIDRSWVHVHQQLPLTIIGVTGCLRYRKELNLLSLGDEEALNLGVDVNRIRWRLFLFVALLTAGSLAGCGIIPFFGLVLPHLIRLYSGADHRVLLPACCLFGASLLLFMELTLRQFSVHALTIGQLSAFFGGLFYLTMVVRRDAFRRSA